LEGPLTLPWADGCDNQPVIGGHANAYMRRLTIEDTYNI
jgi:hypothetical protein